MELDDLRTHKIATASLWFGVSAMYLFHLVVLPLAAVAVGVVALSRCRGAQDHVVGAEPAGTRSRSAVRGAAWRARIGVGLGAVYLWTASVYYLALASGR